MQKIVTVTQDFVVEELESRFEMEALSGGVSTDAWTCDCEEGFHWE